MPSDDEIHPMHLAAYKERWDDPETSLDTKLYYGQAWADSVSTDVCNQFYTTHRKLAPHVERVFLMKLGAALTKAHEEKKTGQEAVKILVDACAEAGLTKKVPEAA
ncbi:MAG: hypothetical protein ABA06_01730 [Parcubacteria bacterium C7867-001]|nr:MAG: hypothetical protein ABA06_01730 [Parcubacteria bacterium C7867-001]